jgi:hypothetical protein
MLDQDFNHGGSGRARKTALDAVFHMSALHPSPVASFAAIVAEV